MANSQNFSPSSASNLKPNMVVSRARQSLVFRIEAPGRSHNAPLLRKSFETKNSVPIVHESYSKDYNCYKEYVVEKLA